MPYINYLPSNILSDIYIFADDTHIFKTIKSPENQDILQNDLDTLSVWSDKWLLKCHPEKSKVVHLGAIHVLRNAIFLENEPPPTPS